MAGLGASGGVAGAGAGDRAGLAAGGQGNPGDLAAPGVDWSGSVRGAAMARACRLGDLVGVWGLRGALGGCPDLDWAWGLVAGLPAAWQERIGRRYAADLRSIGRTRANLAHLARSQRLDGMRCAGLLLDADDGAICERAQHCADHLAHVLDQRALWSADQRGSAWSRLDAVAIWEAQHHVTKMLGDEEAGRIIGEWHGRDMRPLLLRLRDAQWWRRQLRRLMARMVEGESRALGLVCLHRGAYASEGAVSRRVGQLRRNMGTLARTWAVSDRGDQVNLLAMLSGLPCDTEEQVVDAVERLAQRGGCGREVRRTELMVRCAGFDLVAGDMGHPGFFMTLTAPARMHAMTREGRQNPAWDGSSPRDVQRWLSGAWARWRAAAARRGVRCYGLRVAEPHHDGTPHWHLLVWIDPVIHGTRRAGQRVAVRLALALFRRYFVRCESDQPGYAAGLAARRRYGVKVIAIDRARGGAAGYLAKYLAKNLDGTGAETDLLGQPIAASVRRVDAWASTWGVRQFQQVGGPPVGAWRELRRINPAAADDAPELASWLAACNVQPRDAAADDGEPRATAAHGWREYCDLQGGVFSRRRDLRCTVMREQSGEISRFDELLPPVAVGVAVWARRVEDRPAWGICAPYRVAVPVRVEVRSERARWAMVSRHGVAAAVRRMGACDGGAEGEEMAAGAGRVRAAGAGRNRAVCADLPGADVLGVGAAAARGSAGVGSGVGGGVAAAPRIHANNCTQARDAAGVLVVRIAKRGRFDWRKLRKNDGSEGESGGRFAAGGGRVGHAAGGGARRAAAVGVGAGCA